MMFLFVTKNMYGCQRTLLCFLIIIVLSLKSLSAHEAELDDQEQSFYSFKFKNSNGGEVDFEIFKGKVSLVVNVASECGFTDSHYKGLVKLYNELSTSGHFTVLAFPCNQFGEQEPNSSSDVAQFMEIHYGVKFPIFHKINVIEKDVHPGWKYLIDKSGHEPTWNFWKYLVDHNGNVLRAWGPWNSVEEISPVIREAVQLSINSAKISKPHSEL